ncbi:hypothetical protein CEH05_19665 [Halobacillus halophilus]|uniref:HAAS transmembrane region domain-containing protein n=1 Tax=Halobacillus halophilus (strain ATCC 35676 / DSM 2266 / JCM 20832 / KCTC 3685 / LMG 17431 / NBRC 102448 / NCIMB 2269) TaxID=866895 RepID=I0JT73_HALH3|nr:hypothetical protein [Halobacillus halophilus]ASF41261.1 hypothetical protein CEH05_19665 [Halobacillus halophilus]CCG47345.1 hypothetical protein HBHAL_5009 [Halobacillus halophilus DSM 2266]
MELSKESKDFIGRLQLYLMASGKKEKEIEEITEELEDHLLEAERRGKSVQDVVGQSPKEYMEQFSREMILDKRMIFKFIPAICIGALAYLLMGEILDGGVEISILEIIGYPVIFLIIIGLLSFFLRYISSHQLARWKEWMIYAVAGIIPMGSFGALIVLNNYFNTPAVEFGKIGNILAFLVAAAVFVGIAVWSKLWLPIIIPILLFVPEYLIGLTGLSASTQLTLTSIFILAGPLIYFIIVYKKEHSSST